MTGKELVAFCESKIGTNYVYGMKGTIMTQAKYDMLFKQYGKELVWVEDAKKVGTICVDCSGLISWATGIVYGSTQLHDIATYRGTMDKISEAPIGAILWKKGHVGVYAGNGDCIEAKGSKYGTVRTKVSSSLWTNWLKMDYIDYNNVTPTKPIIPEQPISSNTNLKVNDIVTFNGGLVYSNSNAATSTITKGKSTCKITQTYNGKHSYHLVSEDKGGVYGWVDAKDILGLTASISNLGKYKIKGSLNMRKDSNANAEIITVLHDGNIVEPTKFNGTWGYIKAPNGKFGWSNLAEKFATKL